MREREGKRDIEREGQREKERERDKEIKRERLNWRERETEIEGRVKECVVQKRKKKKNFENLFQS